MNYKKKINSHYNFLIKKNGFSKSGIGWSSNKLNKRYDIFNNYINFKNRDVLDFGAGLSHLYFYLKKKDIKFKNYFYYDINKTLKNYIKKQKKPKINFLDRYPCKKYDVVIINGVYNFNYGSNKKVLIKDLKKLFKITKYSLGISFLNDEVDYREPHLFYHNERKILNEVKKFSKKIIIDKSFKGYETFIVLNRH